MPPRQSPILLAGGLGGLALLVVLLLAPLQGITEAPLLGDPGTTVRWAVPVVRVLAEAAGAVSLGALVLVALVQGPERPYRPAARLAGGAAAVWALTEVLLVLLLVSRAGGVSLGDPNYPAVLRTVVTGTALGAGAAVTVVGAVGAVLVTRPWRAGRVELRGQAALAGGMVVIAALAGSTAGHSSHEEQAVMVQRGMHVVGAGAWVGGLVALVVLGPGLWRDRLAVPAVRAYSMAAGWAYAVVALSGLTTAYAVLGSADVRALLAAPDGVGYLRLLALKVLGLVVLGLFGAWHRRRHLPRLDRRGMAALMRLAVVELAVMTVVVAVATVLADTAPPIPVTGAGH